MKPNKLQQVALAVFSLAGTALMGYLLSLKFFSKASSFCELGEGFSCDLVNQSIYSEIFGIPVSLLGLLYFLGVLVAVLWRYNETTLKSILFFSIVFLGPSLYLSYIEFFVLKSICVFCEASKVLILAVIAVSGYALRGRTGRQFVISAMAVGLVFAGVTYFIHANAGPGEKYNALAQCLDEKGYKVYGSITCASCARQRAMFGDAYKFIEEIECDPRNPHNVVELCIAKNIKKTPTWIQEDEAGGELYRFEAGIVSLENLSRVSGCSLE
ncbi:MAG: hypothetical protein A3G49_06060 [Candidatus Sungbacteria bacterium RIFCSPLOWO2_12_FULL_41_11]|uniref:Vitamin K epoxide reductase domain-containing protein n=1 Tax=Candidatus Sungbacteria bacterium RIFCSPLOWO2_12_FULL_41_11 TaxID=1802286 RepID=A0A1G2LT83_9BACT|nr:MAG: hypothetical protein UV01_C0004G0138 [Parcubacteria group bacterium GW2011_GWA2_42_14]OHA14001.1 MAG: hypothetical protein A3G49_06060 [Candidatus Sungbacteria bacterium RIFCSPLOWO2_12_FULL_41_11]